MSFTGEGKTINELPILYIPKDGDYIPISEDGTTLKRIDFLRLCEGAGEGLANNISTLQTIDDLADTDKLLIGTRRTYGLWAVTYGLLKSTLSSEIENAIKDTIKDYVAQQLGDKIANLPAIETGRESVVPEEANKPTSVKVTFTSGRFTSTPRVVATPITSVPGTSVLGVGVRDVSATGFTLYVTRGNTSGNTSVDWIAVGN